MSYDQGFRDGVEAAARIFDERGAAFRAGEAAARASHDPYQADRMAIRADQSAANAAAIRALVPAGTATHTKESDHG